MKYIHAIEGSGIAFIVFSLLVFILPNTTEELKGIETLLTISTFLFAILIGFFLARMNTRYDEMRSIIALEDAHFVSLYRTARIFGKQFQKKIGDLIDTYYIIAFDFDLGNYYKESMLTFQMMYSEVRTLGLSKKMRRWDLYDDLVILLNTMEEDRNKASVIALERLDKSQWFILFLLTGVIIFSLLMMKTPEIYSLIITIILLTLLILILLVLRDLQNFRLNGKVMLEESGEEVFECLGKLRYYNKKYLDEKTVFVPKSVTTYRLGLHTPGEKEQIEIVKR